LLRNREDQNHCLDWHAYGNRPAEREKAVKSDLSHPCCRRCQPSAAKRSGKVGWLAAPAAGSDDECCCQGFKGRVPDKTIDFVIFYAIWIVLALGLVVSLAAVFHLALEETGAFSRFLPVCRWLFF
jgi:hypothetical protein